ncbi:hypothetical protein [Streptomyces kanamyceticus]|uniref:hypothetical protein n=1 Tax=Streptomyces kanamyceticus TaxID=1967 RepID=UPI0037DC3840
MLRQVSGSTEMRSVGRFWPSAITAGVTSIFSGVRVAFPKVTEADGSDLATATAAVQVNNLHLIRSMLGAQAPTCFR